MEWVVPGAAEPGVVGVLFDAGHEADAISMLVRPRHECGFERPGLFKRQVTSPAGARAWSATTRPASHSDPYLREIAWRRENAVVALER
jgi:hypothetical protein